MTVEFSEKLIDMGKQAKEAARFLRKATTLEKKKVLNLMADSIEENAEKIKQANYQDVLNARENGMAPAMLERLTLDDKRLKAMAEGLRKIAQLEDPLAQANKQWKNDNGLMITQRPVPLGVIGIIYESRPNVTADATGLCLKAGNVVLLRGGKEAIASNEAIVEALHMALEEVGFPKESVQLITNPDRQLVTQLMQMNDYVDCLIPRGGAGLIQNVVKNATVPVIETGVGNVHIYIHESADYETARDIVLNAKIQRPSVCNAVESLLVDQAFAERYLSSLGNALYDGNVELVGDEKVRKLIPFATVAHEEEYETEFLDLKLAIKVVANYDEAIQHIEKYSSGHSEAIITSDYQIAQDFLNDIDAAVVYVNASTRFTDGEVFGFGAEIGISTQKLHARGPMGLEALTSYKYTIEGSGQIRE
ncbi:glutamate-5-semialdehyde dehydrogenase [Facklamia sp. DSM 111018]|uniref:Gamma-glutamyl phosphate reductase n=1 Tax=Facklamia lactis TaxID=2749967 RepID=A0ABS0LS51_9LACT|nr:glutamate-5-semialdehyde dehydrogenase [Facklamia lactis]MBG9986295.1 glutamate-5-semialdehyde dehydrogenase [Facklamia lactis]